jgi:hypothetical protein
MISTVPRRSIATALGWSVPVATLVAVAPAAAASTPPQEVLGYFVDDAAHVLVVVNPTRKRIRLRLVVNHIRFAEPTLGAPYRIAGATAQFGQALGQDIAFSDLGVVSVPALGSWVSTISLVRGPGEASFLPSAYSLTHKILLTSDLPYGAGAPVAQRGPIVSTAYLPSATSQPTVTDLPG